MTFAADTSTNGIRSTVQMEGDLDRAAGDTLAGAGALALQDDPDHLVLDFAQVGYINSSGIAALIGLLADAQASGCRVHAIGLTDHYRHVFTLTRLTDYLTVHAGPDDLPPIRPDQVGGDDAIPEGPGPVRARGTP